MNDQNIKAFRNTLNDENKHVVWTHKDTLAVENKRGAGARVRKRRLSAVVIALTLLMVLAVGALASGLVFSKQLDYFVLADAALKEAYGIDTPMLSYFHRYRAISEDRDIYLVRYQPLFSNGYGYVLGAYTVAFKDGKATASWSWDGTPVAEGFDAAPWGTEQLTAMLAVKDNARLKDEYRKKADALAEAAGAKDGWGRTATAEEARAISERQKETDKIVLASMKYSREELVDIARQTVATLYGLPDNCLSYLTDMKEYSGYSIRDYNQPYIVLYLAFGNIEPGAERVALAHPQWKDYFGAYHVTVNVETGEIDDASFDAR